MKYQNLSNSWEQYYSSESINEQRENKEYSSKNQTLLPKEGNTSIYNCYFHDMTAECGGAIYASNANNILVEKCSINNCKATQNTAGIRVTAGNCIIAFTCSQYGRAAVYDGFCSINNDYLRTINSVFDSTISHYEAKHSYIMVHQYVYIKSVNSSHNKANYTSALRCLPTKIDAETNHGSDVLYCSFSNNTATIHQCIQMNNKYNSSCLHEIQNCNIIGNKATNTIYSKGKIKYLSLFFFE